MIVNVLEKDTNKLEKIEQEVSDIKIQRNDDGVILIIDTPNGVMIDLEKYGGTVMIKQLKDINLIQ